jgi:hypothetical protein
MRRLSIGEKLPSQQDLYVNVKEKGDSVTFRLAQDPVYTGKHFVKTGETWKIYDCPRINNPESGDTCERCEEYFAMMKTAKEALESGDKDASEEIKKQARNFSVSIQFYFPILNRDTKMFQVLRTTMGIKNKLDEEALSGVNVMGSEWILRNTGSTSPRDRYSLTRKDSADVLPLDEREETEFKKAENYDLMSISDNVSPVVEEDSSVEDVKEVFQK